MVRLRRFIALDPSDDGFQDSGLVARTKIDLNHCHTLYFNSDWFAPNQSVYAASLCQKWVRYTLAT